MSKKSLMKTALISGLIAFLFSCFTGYIAIQHNTMQSYCIYDEDGFFISSDVACNLRWDAWLPLIGVNFLAAFLFLCAAAFTFLSIRFLIKRYFL